MQSDYSFKSKYNCTLSPEYSGDVSNRTALNTAALALSLRNLTVPEAIDWRTMGAVSSIKKQVCLCDYYNNYAV